jgi:SAM-dependent MidA family methyltransferase
MGSSPDSATQPTPEFLAVFRQHADANGEMSFEQFMSLALYDPAVGYYRHNQERIGYGRGTDFYTASTSGPMFGELVTAACATLLRNAGRDPNDHTFIEIGAEPNRSVLSDVTHPFRDAITFRVGEPLELPDKCIVFSNELFDAQPCLRTVRRGEAWREIAIRLEGERLVEIERSTGFDGPDSPEGYRFDRPLAATKLAEQITAGSWTGLFVAFDYGKTLRELIEETPGGTVRAYYRHTKSNDLLARPGEQDLTCHVCWDWLTSALQRNGFVSPLLDFQETFFIRHAAEFIAATSAAEAARFSQRKLALLQLLHPSHLGQKFQVLYGLR